MSEGYKIVYEGGSGEIEEKKSRFIATVRPVGSEEEVTAFLAEMKKKYWDARHNCFAYVIGEKNELVRYIPRRACGISQVPTVSPTGVVPMA